jgi:hypothetical protein
MGYTTLSISTPQPFVTFTGLKTLVISTHSSDLALIWKFILGVAGTLETLEIEEVDWKGELIPYIPLIEQKLMNFKGHIRLSELTFLRNLKIVATSCGSEFHTKLAQVRDLLSEAASPTRIQHINLHLTVQMHPRMSYRRSSVWTELDNILSGRAFVNLNRLDIRLHFVYTASDKESGNFCYMHGLNLLPQVASNPSVEYRLDMRTTYTPLSMANYLYYSVQKSLLPPK